MTGKHITFYLTGFIVAFLGLVFSVEKASADVVIDFSTVYSTSTYDSASSTFTDISNYAIFIPTGTQFDRIQFAVQPGSPQLKPHLLIAGQRTILLNAGYPGQTAATQVRPVSISRIAPTIEQWTFSPITMPADRTHLLIAISRDGTIYQHYSNFIDETDVIKSAPTDAGGNTSSPIVDGGIGFRLCYLDCDGDAAFVLSDPPLVANPAQNAFITITKPVPYGVLIPEAGNVETRAYFFYDVAQATTTKTQIDIYDALTNTLEHSASVIVPTGSTVNFEMPATFDMATGSKKMIASYKVAATNQDLLVPQEWFFSVATNTYLLATGLETPESVPAGLTQIDCTLFDIGCQFQRAMVFVFVPSQTVLNKFSALWQELKYIKPFGYVTVFLEQINGVNAGATGAYTLPAIPFIDAIFAPLKAAMAILLWGVFAFVFYNKRLKTLDL